MTVLVALESVVLALLALLVISLLRSHAEILRRLHELGLGEGAPARPMIPPPPEEVRRGLDLAGRSPHGETVAIGVAGSPGQTLLAFLSSGCLTCSEFWGAFSDLGRLGLPAGMRLVVVTRGPESESVSAIAELASPDLTVCMSSEAWAQYAVPGSPYFVLVDGPSGEVVGEGTAVRWDQVASLVSQADADRSAADGAAANGAAANGAAANGAAARSPRPREGDRDRRERVDAELLAAGIGPDHPSLYPEAGGPADGDRQ